MYSSNKLRAKLRKSKKSCGNKHAEWSDSSPRGSSFAMSPALSCDSSASSGRHQRTEVGKRAWPGPLPGGIRGTSRPSAAVEKGRKKKRVTSAGKGKRQ
ncbi:hypothetical protein NL676_012024 [Syzygium grande]|nr:hypothetical protein NL676_012024 [Syzygium grande]